ncbi:MAG: hypothetical protein QOE63_416, partial [Acidimicrobiaceae bacterium]
WAELEAAAPSIAAKGRALLYQYGPPLGFLATVRPDGGPRLHPFCPIIYDGHLWAYVLERSPKCRDLRRDPRFALHAMPPEAVDDELMIRGRATFVDAVSDALRGGIVAAAKPASVGAETEVLFELHLDRVMLATYTHRGQWPPVYEKWIAPEA